jgi:hypothetical protein
MSKYVFLFCLGMTFTTFAAPASSEQQTLLLIKFQQDIFAEVIRSYGHQIELSGEVKLSLNELQRTVCDSFIVTGNINVKAAEVLC